MNKLTRHINAVLKGVMIFLMAVLLIDVCWQVFSRYVLQNPSSFTDELARFLLIWLTLFGAAYLAGQKEHLAIEILSNKMNPLLHSVLMNGFMFIFAFFVMVIGGAILVSTILELDQMSPNLQIPMGYVYLVIPISGFLICYFSIANITQQIRER